MKCMSITIDNRIEEIQNKVNKLITSGVGKNKAHKRAVFKISVQLDKILEEYTEIQNRESI